jgi:DNA processing protein
MVPEIGPVRFKKLLAVFGSAENAVSAGAGEIAQAAEVSGDIARRIISGFGEVSAEAEMNLCEKNGVQIITLADKDYPETLSLVENAPPVIYVKGTLEKDDIKSIAVVGSRRATGYGLDVAARFSRQFAQERITVISGLARGIDSAAHASALAAKGRTIAVLGNGLMKHYPPENRKLEDKIIENGALLSEFPMNVGPDKSNFPRRNRIISGLALAVLVIEADIKSGALITAKHSLDQGKDVFAVPGPIFSIYSKGPHYLIRSGARLVEDAADIIDELEPLSEWVKSKKQKIEREEGAELTLSQQNIISALENEFRGLTMDALSGKLKLTPSEIARDLLEQELQGFVRCLPGSVYAVMH